MILSAATSVDEYFISNRSLRWPSIALSTVGTNIHAGHFLGMAGSAYLYGLAQANLEINALFAEQISWLAADPALWRERRLVRVREIFQVADRQTGWLGFFLLASLLFLQVHFH